MSCCDNSAICRECGGYCCRLGGTRATKDEVDAILGAGHESHFVRVTEKCYITPWGDDGVCPYLKDSTCTIYEIRPLVCQKFPIVKFSNHESFIVHCPLTQHLSKEDIDYLIEVSSRLPEELIEEAAVYFQPYARILDERIRVFRLDRINDDGMNAE
ncbi:MAG: hypothetical protein C4K48_04745 [Candidatus Thorarchaeota archaeon]|nr:MAG: hypothetical protein C4K48_04745 [Candidatus Thorarchaeota archaeon]